MINYLDKMHENLVKRREREREREMRVPKKREKFDTTFDDVNVLVRMLYFVKRKC